MVSGDRAVNNRAAPCNTAPATTQFEFPDSRVAADSAVDDCQNCGAVVIDSSAVSRAAATNSIASDGTIDNRQRRAPLCAVIVNASASVERPVGSYRTIGER